MDRRRKVELFEQIRREKPETSVSESTIRRYVAVKKRESGCMGKDVAIAQSYAFGEEAQVDWYEAYALRLCFRHQQLRFRLQLL